MASPRQELTLRLDWEFIDACNGFSFDMGGSVMKLAFVDKDDWVEPQNRKKDSYGQIRLVNFHRKELDEAYEFINKRVRIPRKTADEMPTIYSTGFGGSQFGGKIQEINKVKNNQLMEMDCFTQSFMHLLRKLPRKEVLHPVYEPPFEESIKEEQAHRKMMKKMKGKSEMIDRMIQDMDDSDIQFKQLVKENTDKPLSELEDLFPCAIMMCGSGFAFSVIDEDGLTKPFDMSHRGGKTFVAMGSLITGAKNYAELMDLCEKGNALNVHDTSKSLFKENKITEAGEDDVYGAMGDMLEADEFPEQLTFCLGRAEGKSPADFSKEDLARSILDTHVNDVVHYAVLDAFSRGVKHVFFCGGFVNHHLVREVITYHWLKRCHLARVYNPEHRDEIQVHFLVHAQSLGAIGALMNHHLLWSEKHKET